MNTSSQPAFMKPSFRILVRSRNGTGALKGVVGEMLTFMGSKSQGYQCIREQNVVEFADENFAREIMQLFTIGPYELNMDGSHKLDSNGNSVRTYSNDDVMEVSSC
jgi:hypothetical protein